MACSALSFVMGVLSMLNSMCSSRNGRAKDFFLFVPQKRSRSVAGRTGSTEDMDIMLISDTYDGQSPLLSSTQVMIDSCKTLKVLPSNYLSSESIAHTQSLCIFLYNSRCVYIRNNYLKYLILICICLCFYNSCICMFCGLDCA